MADAASPAPASASKDAGTGAGQFGNMSNRMKAILLMCGAVTFFSCLDAMAKYIAAHSNMGTAQIVWLRFLGQMLLMAALLGPAAIPSLLKTEKPALQALRSMMLLGTTAFNFLAVQHLRLDQTISIAFLAPLVVAALAGPVLGEWVGWRRALAIVAGFFGVLIVVRPGFAEVHWAFGASFLSMLSYATFMLVTRRLSTYDQPLTTLFLGLLAGAAACAPIAIAHWVWPADWQQWLMLLSLGALGGFGHYLMIFAYRYAPASSVSPFLYFQLLSMVGLGYFVFGDVPDKWTLIGSSIVIASGLYLVHRERVTRHEPV